MKKIFLCSALLCLTLFVLLPMLHSEVTDNSLAKDIDANVYLYTEIDIDHAWSK